MKKNRKKKLNPYEWIEELDWDRFPSLVTTAEEAIARIDKFEKDLADGNVKWISAEELHADLINRFPFLANLYTNHNLRRNMILSITDENGIKRNVIILPVTRKDLKRSVNADRPGLYGFSGLWYKGNGTKIKSYGKIFDIAFYDDIKIVRDNILGLSKKQLKEILK